jgi:hypothetical protein
MTQATTILTRTALRPQLRSGGGARVEEEVGADEAGAGEEGSGGAVSTMAACRAGEAGGNAGRRRPEGRCCLLGRSVLV